LSEIGSFFKTVVISERNKKAQEISNIWQGNNLTLEGLEQVLHSIGSPSNLDKKQASVTPEEATKNWKKLASFMSANQG